MSRKKLFVPDPSQAKGLRMDLRIGKHCFVFPEEAARIALGDLRDVRLSCCPIPVSLESFPSEWSQIEWVSPTQLVVFLVDRFFPDLTLTDLDFYLQRRKTCQFLQRIGRLDIEKNLWERFGGSSAPKPALSHSFCKISMEIVKKGPKGYFDYKNKTSFELGSPSAVVFASSFAETVDFDLLRAFMHSAKDFSVEYAICSLNSSKSFTVRKLWQNDGPE